MKNRTIYLLLTIIILTVSIFTFISCDNVKKETKIGFSEKTTENSIEVKYELLTTEKDYIINIKNSDKLDIVFEIISNDGKIELLLTKDGKEYYKGNSLPTTKFTVSVDEIGEYTLKVCATKHSGAYTIKWND